MWPLALIQWLTLLIYSVCYSCASKIDSHDLFIGTWDTEIRCSEAQYHELFPRRRSEVPNDSEARPMDSVAPDSIRTRRMQQRKRSRFPCVFSVYPNGTFGLHPQVTDGSIHCITQQGTLLERDIDEVAIEAVSSLETESSTRLPIHGRWTIDINPYCVTDRFHDDISLISHPRVQTKSDGTRESTVQTMRLHLKCRLSGHFTGNRLWFQDRHQYARGRLSHGSLVVNRIDDTAPVENTRRPWWYQPRIAATFSARRLIPSRAALASQSNDYDDDGGRSIY